MSRRLRVPAYIGLIFVVLIAVTRVSVPSRCDGNVVTFGERGIWIPTDATIEDMGPNMDFGLYEIQLHEDDVLLFAGHWHNFPDLTLADFLKIRFFAYLPYARIETENGIEVLVWRSIRDNDTHLHLQFGQQATLNDAACIALKSDFI